MNHGKEFKRFAQGHQGISSMHLNDYVDSSMTPYIIEERQMNVAQMDVFSRLMMDRIIFLGTGLILEPISLIPSGEVFINFMIF